MKILLGVLLTLSSSAFAFPELARAGYANCVTCHQSPSGGGLLTPYGRALSGELMSSNTSEGEERFLYAITPPEGLTLGGDIRALQLYQNRNLRRNSKFIFMQADVEAAAALKQFSVDVAAGIDSEFQPISRRHYLQFKANDELGFRAGRFLPAAGINSENHFVGAKRGIGRDQSTETYNFEASWIAPNYDVFVTGILGRPDDKKLGAEGGAAISSSLFLANRFKVGASYSVGSRDLSNRHLVGPFAILGFTPRFFLMIDSSVQFLAPKGGEKSVVGFVDTARLDYELFKGFHAFLTQDYALTDFKNGSSALDAYGFGLQWFPRPHLELSALWTRQRIGGTSATFADYAYLLAHFYP